MAQEFTINSATIESKINQLLPSQGGAGAGVDFSASTMIVPIIDLTQSAEGSSLRQDLQTSLSHGSITAFSVSNTTSTIINTTGYWRLFGTMSTSNTGSSAGADISVSDGTTSKVLLDSRVLLLYSGSGTGAILPFDFIVKLEAGHSITAQTGQTIQAIKGCFRQIATIDDELVNP
tara:strand:+ start:104 stop:631 length:528 start_codon:yes stop_codon:yes gene_type:complete